jgi:hypothetical protein
MSSSARRILLVICVALCVGSGSAWAQNRYDDHELTDRVYFSLGGFSQTDIRTTIRVDAKSPSGAIRAGTVIGVESLFDVDDQVSTGRLDGWYRFNKKHRIGLTYWRTAREGLSTYNGDESIELGDIVIDPGDTIATDDKSQLLAMNWSFSFVNTSKYEAWIGAGLNFHKIDADIQVNVGGGTNQLQQDAKGTVPIPTLNFGGRWNFSPRWRMFLIQQLFGIKIGDFSGKLSNTRILAEFDITSNFGIGGGFERFNFEVDAEGDEFVGQMDMSYTAFSLYLKGQF